MCLPQECLFCTHRTVILNCNYAGYPKIMYIHIKKSFCYLHCHVWQIKHKIEIFYYYTYSGRLHVQFKPGMRFRFSPTGDDKKEVRPYVEWKMHFFIVSTTKYQPRLK